MSNLDIGSTMQKLLEEFDTKEALTREEISLVQQNIQELERRILVTEERLKVINHDKTKILSIHDKYKNLSFARLDNINFNQTPSANTITANQLNGPQIHGIASNSGIITGSNEVKKSQSRLDALTNLSLNSTSQVSPSISQTSIPASPQPNPINSSTSQTAIPASPQPNPIDSSTSQTAIPASPQPNPISPSISQTSIPASPQPNPISPSTSQTSIPASPQPQPSPINSRTSQTAIPASPQPQSNPINSSTSQTAIPASPQPQSSPINSRTSQTAIPATPQPQSTSNIAPTTNFNLSPDLTALDNTITSTPQSSPTGHDQSANSNNPLNDANLFSFGQQLANSYSQPENSTSSTQNQVNQNSTDINSLADALSGAIESVTSPGQVITPSTTTQPVSTETASDKNNSGGEDLWLDFNYENDDNNDNNNEESKEAAKSMDDALRGLFR